MTQSAPSTRFERLQEILNSRAQNGAPFHGGKHRFWNVTYDEFAQEFVQNPGLIYDQQLIAGPGSDRAENSALYCAVAGLPPFDGSKYFQMPLGQDPLLPDELQFVHDWIDDGCPNDPWPPAPPASTGSGASAMATASLTPTITVMPAIKSATLQLRTAGVAGQRKNIVNMQDNEWEKLRAAFAEMQALPPEDERSYQYWADIHWHNCDHGNPWIWPWHRAYLYLFELELQKHVPGVTLPYWDWSTTREIFAQYATPTVGDAPNPLYHAERDPGNPADLPGVSEIAGYQNSPNFPKYTLQLEIHPHNGVHGWVGADMGDQTTSARDPIFWTHHANLDRLWSEWQAGPHGADPPQPTRTLAPWTLTVQDVLDISQLGYSYVTDFTLFLTDSAVALADFQSPDANISTSLLQNGFRSAELQFHNVQHPIGPAGTYFIRVFLNQPDADEATARTGNPHYAGDFALFGHRRCYGGVGHCDVPSTRLDRFDLRPPSRKTPFEVSLDVTDTVRELAKSAGDIQVKLVIVDPHGKAVTSGVLKLDGVSLVIQG